MRFFAPLARFEGMPVEIGFDLFLTFDGTINLLVWDHSFFGEAV